MGLLILKALTRIIALSKDSSYLDYCIQGLLYP